MKKITGILIMLLISSVFTGYSQNTEVKNYLKMVAQGKVDEVKLALPDLLADYPDDAGVLLLHASVLDDANKAIDIYEKIVKKHPESEYADMAYWRIVQYYAIKGDIERANQELEGYRQKFPSSEFLAPASDVVRTAAAIAKSGGRPRAFTNEKVKKDELLPKKEAEKPKEKKTETVAKNTEKTQPKTTKTAKPADEDSDSKGSWGLQVGVYSTQERAKDEVERFRSPQNRLRADIIPKKVDGATMYAVIIGEYSSRESAEQAKNIVQQKCNCNPLILKK